MNGLSQNGTRVGKNSTYKQSSVGFLGKFFCLVRPEVPEDLITHFAELILRERLAGSGPKQLKHFWRNPLAQMNADGSETASSPHGPFNLPGAWPTYPPEVGLWKPELAGPMVICYPYAESIQKRCPKFGSLPQKDQTNGTQHTQD